MHEKEQPYGLHSSPILKELRRRGVRMVYMRQAKCQWANGACLFVMNRGTPGEGQFGHLIPP